MSAILPTDLTPEEREHLWKEYHVLEARMQNDSRIAYGIVAALLGGTFVLLVAGLSYYLNLRAEGGISSSDVPTLATLWASPILLSRIAGNLLRRVNRTGDVRRARAVQIEKRLRLYSYRLWPPWSDLPQGYMLELGEISRNEKHDSSGRMASVLEWEGVQYYGKINKMPRLFGLVKWAFRGSLVLVSLMFVAIFIA